jgi:phosphoglycolate phosphatase-like HAD superfamily hydrolase
LVVGDKPTDIEVGRKMGLRTAAVSPPAICVHADMHVADLDELFDRVVGSV